MHLFTQIMLDKPFGNNPMSNLGLVILGLLLLLLSLFILSIRLKTRITEEGIFVQFFPFHLRYRQFKWNELSKVYLRKYRPIAEYGGWGWRISISGKGKAYNISGNIGLQLELSNGKKLLIGTQQAEELKTIINNKIKIP